MARNFKTIPARLFPSLDKPTLFSYLSVPALKLVSKEGFRGKSYVPLSGLLHICSYLYETGAIMGRVRRDHLTELISMSFRTDMQYCLQETQYSLRKRLESSGRYAHSFYTFYLHGTMRDMNLSFDTDGMKEAHNDIRVKSEVEYFLECAGVEGLLLGAKYPELAEKMYGQKYGAQRDTILEMLRDVVICPEESTYMPIQDREKLVLNNLNNFTSQYNFKFNRNLEANDNEQCKTDERYSMEQVQYTEAYLDIETTGLDPAGCYITVIGIHVVNVLDQSFTQLVGKDVTVDNILEALAGVNSIYTYNGSRFDLPFIYSCLGINLAIMYSHHDLMYDCWQHNLYGGFKSVERQLGINRRLKEINGYQAVRLWWRYLNDYDEDALNILLEYNKEDVLNLRILKEKLL